MTVRIVGYACLALASVSAAVGIGHAVTTDATYNRPSAIFPKGNVARGKTLAATCLACHGENGPLAGSPPVHPPKLRHQHPSSIFYALQDYKNGNRKSDFMAPVASALSDQDMRDVAAYLSGAAKRPPPRRPPGPGQGPPMVADTPGRVEVKRVCGFCHGLTGQGVMDGVPGLGGQYQDYLKHALADYRSGARTNPTMRAVVKNLTPQQTEAVTTYLAEQSTLEVAQ